MIKFFWKFFLKYLFCFMFQCLWNVPWVGPVIYHYLKNSKQNMLVWTSKIMTRNNFCCSSELCYIQQSTIRIEFQKYKLEFKWSYSLHSMHKCSLLKSTIFIVLMTNVFFDNILLHSLFLVVETMHDCFWKIQDGECHIDWFSVNSTLAHSTVTRISLNI